MVKFRKTYVVKLNPLNVTLLLSIRLRKVTRLPMLLIGLENNCKRLLSVVSLSSFDLAVIVCIL